MVATLPFGCVFAAKFDFDNLLKTYELDCSNAFERAQVYMLTYTVASHHTYVFESVAHDGRPIDLVPS